MELLFVELTPNYDHIAPDFSEIRLLISSKHGGLAHCLLPANMVSQAVKHKTVEEIWYVLEGEGKMWRKNEDHEEVVNLIPNTCINIPVGTSFQFKNIGPTPLKILLSTMHPWPGADEAIKAEGYWNSTKP